MGMNFKHCKKTVLLVTPLFDLGVKTTMLKKRELWRVLVKLVTMLLKVVDGYSLLSAM
jgi:hypothetical protein